MVNANGIGYPHRCPACGEMIAIDRDKRFGMNRRRVVEMATGLTHYCGGPRRDEMAAATASKAVTRLADALAAESEARADYYRQRAGAGRPAPVVSAVSGGLTTPLMSGPPSAFRPPAVPHHPERSISEEIAL